MSNVKDKVTKQDRELFIEKLMDHMNKAAKEKNHMMWQVEILPDHSFIVEQSANPHDFRLYQSWLSAFDINYWLSESRSETPCYEAYWGRSDELKYQMIRYLF